jgi:hypothetical protein
MGNVKKALQELLEGEPIPLYEFTAVSQDSDHGRRRSQQRAISEEFIQIALLLGQVEYVARAKTYTLTDRQLAETKFSKFLDELRGVRIITEPPSPLEEDGPIRITTVMWAEEVRNRKPKLKFRS